uniref:BLUF domain-containing protein n=1 Tax=Clastoptera arizonana TaxID=38151 RepID=A0A1B6CZD9_9HEMI
MDSHPSKSDIIQNTNRSFLSVLVDNLKSLGRKNYLHRLIYIFEYTATNVDFSIHEILSDMIRKINESYSDEPLTGIFLYYQHYGINMIEGSEEIIFKHIQEFVSDEYISNNVGRIKILLAVSHIKQVHTR